MVPILLRKKINADMWTTIGIATSTFVAIKPLQSDTKWKVKKKPSSAVCEGLKLLQKLVSPMSLRFYGSRKINEKN